MHCANEAAPKSAARVRAAGELISQGSAVGDHTPAAEEKHPATPIVAGARGAVGELDAHGPAADLGPASSAQRMLSLGMR